MPLEWEFSMLCMCGEFVDFGLGLGFCFLSFFALNSVVVLCCVVLCVKC